MTKTNLPAVPDPQVADDKKKSFKGYTMEELRYQKALALLRKEFCKSNVLHSIEELKHPLRQKAESSKLLTYNREKPKRKTATTLKAAGSVAKVVATQVFRGMKPLDIIMLGISLIGPARKVVRLMRRK